MPLLDRERILEAFTRLNDRLAERAVRAELYLLGGAVMCLAHASRPSTRDVDAWFTEPQAVRKAAQEVAADLGLEPDWLNDAAKGFMPANAGFETWRSWSNLTVSVADPATLLAMKCAAARTELDSRDIRFLAKHLGLHSSAAILDLVTKYYPSERLHVRSRLLLEELFDARD